VKPLPRTIAVILYADVAGYSRLTGDDEDSTHLRLREGLDHISQSVERHRGDVLHFAGDAVLARFSAAVDAMDCAADIQRTIQSMNERTSADEPLLFRIGVNLGDVIEDRGEIYGDGINIAARLQALAEPGGIVISGAVFDSLGGANAIEVEDLGLKTVKNIKNPVRALQVRGPGKPQGQSPAPVKNETRGKPSLAVLPFKNLSGGSDQEYFADGISEDLITSLSRLPWFSTTARNTSFTFKDRAVDVKTAAQDLNVNYVLEGSVRRSANKVRVTAQLIDGTNGHHIWANRYDRELTDLFDLQDEIVIAITGAVAPEFLSIEARRARSKASEHLDAWDLMMRGRWHLWQMSREDLSEARALFKKAIELVPTGEYGASDLAVVHLWEFLYGWTGDPTHSMNEMLRLSQQAALADAKDPWALSTLALSALFARHWDAAEVAAERAFSLNPDFPQTLATKGMVLTGLGDPRAGVILVEEAIRRSPDDVLMPIWLVIQGLSLFLLGRYEDGVACTRRCTQIAPSFPTAYRQLAACHAMLGALDDARAALEDLGRYLPSPSLSQVRERVPIRSEADMQKFLEGLRRAGMAD
jgi:adenylate cyclase